MFCQPFTPRSVRRLLPLGVLLICFTSVPFALGQEDSGKLDNAVQSLADKLADFLKEENANDVSIGSFTGPAQLSSTAGPAIKNKLVDALKENEIANKRRTGIGVKGEFHYDREDGTVLLRMKAMKGPRELVAFDEKIYDIEDMTSLLGLSGKTAVEAPPAEQREQLKTALDQLEVATDEGATIIKPTPDSLYGIEILRVNESGASPVSIINDDGIAYADLQIEDTYMIRVINNSPHYAAVKISIDGLNLFAFSQVPHYRALGYVLVPPSPKGSLIKGWHINNQQSDTFLVTDAGKFKGVLAHDETLATITAQFAVAVPPGSPFPVDEPTLKSLRTARGPSIEARYNSRPARIGQIREFVSIRYVLPLP